MKIRNAVIIATVFLFCLEPVIGFHILKQEIITKFLCIGNF